MFIVIILLFFILLVLLRKPIKALLTVGLIYIIFTALWEADGWWGKPLAVLMIILVVVGSIGSSVDRSKK